MATAKRCNVMFTVINAIITALIIESQCRLHHLVLKVCVCCARNVAIGYSYSHCIVVTVV